MIVSQREIYKEVAEENNIEKGVVISIGEFIWDKTRENLDEPGNLGVELSKLGTFTLRFKRFESYIKVYERAKNSPININNPEFHRRLFKYKNLIREIENYRKQKSIKRKLRYNDE